MYKKILAPLDGSQLSECSLNHVKAIAQGCQVPEVIILRVVEPIHSTDIAAYAEAGINIDVLMDDIESTAQKYTSKIAEDLKTSGIAATGMVLVGPAADMIMKYADENGVDLIIMSTHGRSGISRWLLGSVAERVVRHSHIPVLVVSAPGCQESQK
jgi:nucleotide-binding universal stress UspA family protein